MKNTKIFAVLLSAVILASCGTSHDVVDGGIFQKRKYNKGFHVSKKSKVSTKTENTEENTASAVTIEKTELKSSEIILEPTSNNDVAIITQNSTVSSDQVIESESIKDVKSVESKKTNSNVGVVAKNSRNMKRTGASSIFKNTPLSVDHSNNTSDEQDTTDNTLLLVIIALFIPFLAVGLYEGLTTRFWISLLLTLLFVLPGVIYAILVVTGTI